ncbi:flavodoxin [Hornefia porci]|uniref:Flavodoxin n=1 Tax=Hornefia porci TaxID=2652292 RepID=A0A1Q9JK22_9FIRM|nr:NAD(P)H-dependent oxidoreductase [Hornefia porci]OLR56516.1 flavodoxin [Hornefia porci]
MLTVLKIGWEEGGNTRRIDYVLNRALREIPAEEFRGCEAFTGALEKKRWHGGPLLIAVCLPHCGVCLDAQRLIGWLNENRDSLRGTTAGILIDGKGELYTKNLARQVVFSANRAGAAFPGKALVEATGDMYNFNVISKISQVGHYEAYARSVENLVHKLLSFRMPFVPRPEVLAVHASNSTTSNSLLLWEMIRQGIGGRCNITEISLRNGTVVDCSGCSYETCVHFGEQGDCLYGGVMVEQVYPAILRCDTLVMICPNYNDAVSANITAFINRLTALFRTNDFSGKKVYALVVSGYSGGDIVAEQIIGAMCFNKSFILPGNFALVETANDPGSILERLRIQKRAAEMAARICGKEKAADQNLSL